MSNEGEPTPSDVLWREVFGVPDGRAPVEPPPNTHPLFPLRQIWPEVVELLTKLLADAGEESLASTVAELVVFDRCQCGMDDCATVYTRPRPRGPFGPSHRNVAFFRPSTICLDTGRSAAEDGLPTAPYMVILDVVDDQIACIEILDEDCRRMLIAALP